MKVLVVEDESGIRDLIKMNLELENFDVLTARNGKDGLNLFERYCPNIVILDLMLPDIDGFEVLRKMQEIDYEIPVIILTAKNSQNEKLLGLELGADDYITKPFHSRELILRIRVILKRLKKAHKNDQAGEKIVEFGPIKLVKGSYEIFLSGEALPLTKKEFELLSLLMEKRGHVLSRDFILQEIWGFETSVDTRAVDMTVQRIRKKLGEHSACIKSIYGIGYKFEA